jgi:arylsulfatase
VQLGDRTYKNHLDGYDQVDLLTGAGPSKRHEIYYFGGPHLGAIRIDDFKFQFFQQPWGWPGEKITTDMPTIVNLRQDPFERTPALRGESLNEMGAGYMNDFYGREFWLRNGAAIHREIGGNGYQLSAYAGAREL